MGMDLQSEMIPNVDGLAYVGGEWDASKYAPFDVDKDKIILERMEMPIPSMMHCLRAAASSITAITFKLLSESPLFFRK